MTATITTDGCGFLGNSRTVPFTATWEGDALPQISVPSVVPPIAPPPAVPQLPVETPSPQDEQLLADLADHGVTASDFNNGARDEWAATRAVCALRTKGTSADSLVSQIQADTTMKLSEAQARWLVKLATAHLCPQYAQ